MVNRSDLETLYDAAAQLGAALDELEELHGHQQRDGVTVATEAYRDPHQEVEAAVAALAEHVAGLEGRTDVLEDNAGTVLVELPAPAGDESA